MKSIRLAMVMILLFGLGYPTFDDRNCTSALPSSGEWKHCL
jgi:hypothetical protein